MRLATRTTTLPSQGVFVMDTAAVPELQQATGSVTVTSRTPPYGALGGRSVALEPATGFAFDTHLEYRPR